MVQSQLEFDAKPVSMTESNAEGIETRAHRCDENEQRLEDLHLLSTVRKAVQEDQPAAA